MEWLAEVEDVDMPPDDDFFALDEAKQRTERPLSGRLFMVFANQAALDQMLSLWRSWQRGQSLGPWGTLFAQLRDVRRWGVRDRLYETGVLDDWRERVEHGEQIVPCELELWHRGSQEVRELARDRVVALVEGQGGVVLEEATISEIAYQVVLAELPVGSVGALLAGSGDDIDLMQCERIQFIRAGGQMAAPTDDDGLQDQQDEETQTGPLPTKPPTIALLDGLPLQGHRRLQGRLVVDDPDDFESNYPANQRVHGTAMASLITHADLGAGEPPLPSRLYVRPILLPDPRDWRNHREAVPESVLVVDLLHRAIHRLFETAGAEPATAPEVAVVNLSIGIGDRPFHQAMSPLARLLDWLSWRYKVLFVVSAGNHAQPIRLAVSTAELDAMEDAAVQQEVLRAVAADARHRRLLSPAESLNALTVASMHDDASIGEAPDWFDPLERGLPSPVNAQGMGFRRAVKPDVFAPGGRVAWRKPLTPTEAATELDVYTQAFKPGQRVAAPGATLGDVSGTRHSRGTSNATALVSRAAAFLHEVLDELRSNPDGEVIDDVPHAVWLKAMIAHGADWGEAGSTLAQLLRNPSNSRKFKEYVTRLLGYGAMDVDRVSECTAWRVTAISGGDLGEDESHIHAFPLPPSLIGLPIRKRLTITLAWLSPINPRHQAWRRAQLWFDPPKDQLKVDRLQADYRAVQRGTLQHEILEGRAAAAFSQGDDLEIQVNCRADAGTLEERVPYALITTLEVAEDLMLDIYDEVRTAVQAARLRV